MATRCNIFVKIRKEDSGKTLRIDLDKITGAESLKNLEFKTSRFKEVTLEHDYIGIYNHWDGYPEGGVGLTLQNHYNSYDLALNLVLGGNVSTINTTYKPYICMGDANWESEEPRQQDTEPKPTESYLYLFDNNQWWFKRYGDTDWISLRWFFDEDTDWDDL